MKQCVFINTEDNPVKIERLGIFRYQYESYKSNKIFFSEMCELWFPHPDAPEDAKVSVYRWLSVEIEFGTEHLAKQCIDAMQGIQKITKLR